MLLQGAGVVPARQLGIVRTRTLASATAPQCPGRDQRIKAAAAQATPRERRLSGCRTLSGQICHNTGMATLREYFLTEYQGGMHFDYHVEPNGSGPKVTVIAHAHWDFVGNVRYVSYFIPEGGYSKELADFLVHTPERVLVDGSAQVEMHWSHPATYSAPLKSSDLPFSGRVFLYIDQVVPPDEISAIITAASNRNIRLEIKDRTYSDYQTLHQKPWAFISHDSRDKEEVARPVASKLMSMACPVWYDEYSLKVGDSIRESIDRGLHEAPRCIVILSPNFLSNPGWTKGEFNAAINRHFSSERRVVVPIWYRVSREEVAAYSELITDIYALRFDGQELDILCRKLFAAISPDK
jgi:hypothetical protein